MNEKKVKIGVIITLILLLGISVIIKQRSLLGKSAVIVDQLFGENTGFGFVERTQSLFYDKGYEVKVFQGEEVTLDLFYNTVWDMEIIILRMHSGVFDNRTWLFTHEEYDPAKHVLEQLSRDVNIGRCKSVEYPVFTLSSSFFQRNIDFNGVLVVVMGCNGFDEPDLVTFFVESGAVAVVGWNGAITVEETDESVLIFLENILSGKTFGESIGDTGLEFYPDSALGYKLG